MCLVNKDQITILGLLNSEVSIILTQDFQKSGPKRPKNTTLEAH